MKLVKEFSKRLLIINYFTALFFTGMLVILVMLGQDVTALSNVVLAVWAEYSLASGLYYWKAKHENMIKLGMINSQEEQ